MIRRVGRSVVFGMLLLGGLASSALAANMMGTVVSIDDAGMARENG